MYNLNMPGKTLKTASGSEKVSSPLTTIVPQNYSNIFALGFRNLAAIFISVALIFGMYLIGNNWSSLFQSSHRYITVTGTSSSNVKNEIARFNASVTVTNESKEQALSEANEKIKSILDAIKAYGVTDKDIKTNTVNVFQMEEPYYEDGIQKFSPGDWRAYMGIEIVYRDIDSIDMFAEMLALLDISDMSGPNFENDDSKLDESGLLRSAVKNASIKANELATISGGKLGKIVNIVETGSNQLGIVPMYDRGMGGGGGIPMQPGTSEVSRSVTVTYELN